MANLICIEKQLRRFKRAYSNGRRQNEGAIKQQAIDYYEFLQNFDENLVNSAGDRWLDENDKVPNAMQLARLCRMMKNNISVNDEVPIGQLICDYYSYFSSKNIVLTFGECKICQLPDLTAVNDEIANGNESVKCLTKNALVSKKFYGFVLCAWHQTLALAKIYPAGAEEKNISELIRLMKY